MASKQYAYQLRHKAKGLCILCPKPAVTTRHCQTHLEMKRKIARDWTRKILGLNPWKPGSPGRPPLPSKS